MTLKYLRIFNKCKLLLDARYMNKSASVSALLWMAYPIGRSVHII